jgi:hypothetical protein
MADRRITQVGLEVATLNTTPTLRVTQVGLEVAVDTYTPEPEPPSATGSGLSGLSGLTGLSGMA